MGIRKDGRGGVVNVGILSLRVRSNSTMSICTNKSEFTGKTRTCHSFVLNEMPTSYSIIGFYKYLIARGALFLVVSKVQCACRLYQ